MSERLKNGSRWWRKLPIVLRRFILAAAVMWALYGVFVVLPHIRANQPVGNASEVALKGQAQETLSILSELKAERNDQPDDALALSSLQSVLNKQLDGLKAIDQGKLDSGNKNTLKQAIKSLDLVIKASSGVSNQYGKILTYYPESDLYGDGVDRDASLERSGNAVNNLKKLTIQNRPSSDALQNVISCLEALQKDYQKNACVPQYKTLRQAAINDIRNQFNSPEVSSLQEQLTTLLR